MITLFDSISLDQIPADAEAVAGYTSGFWPTYDQIVVRWPHAHHLSIAVTAAHRARCLDVEAGDARNDQAASWLDNLADPDPVLYTSAGNAAALRSAVGGRRFLLWSAHYTHQEHICSPGGCGYPQADATQWTDKALGRNLDQSLCSDRFFARKPSEPVPPPSEATAGLAVAHLGSGAQVVFTELTSGEVKFKRQQPSGRWSTWTSLGKPG